MDGVQSFFRDPAHAYALWFVLGSLWAVLVCEYRAYRRRLKLVAHIRVLETELMHAEDHFLSEQTLNDRVRAELLDMLGAARSSRFGKTRVPPGRAILGKHRHEAAE